MESSPKVGFFTNLGSFPPEAQAELDKLEEKEKAKAEMTTRGTTEIENFGVPKAPRGGVFSQER